MEQKEVKQIDFVELFKKISTHKTLFLISLPLTIILSYLLICCVPRYYSCTVKLAPEISSFDESSLGSLASSFGVDLNMGSQATQDAITPELYPDLMESVDFKVGMFNVEVKSNDNKISTDYYNYLLKYQKESWWNKVFDGIKNKFGKKTTQPPSNKVNPFKLTKEQSNIANIIGHNIECKIDKKNDAIIITADDQDPLIAATIADAAKTKLQNFITEYRTRKAKKDVANTKKLYYDAKAKYEKIRRVYGAYSDANTDVSLPSVQSKLEDMENEMQLQYNIYTALNQQLQKAQARLIEQTPAFTTLQSATVPIKPAGPKRLIFVLVITGLVFIIDVIYSISKK